MKRRSENKKILIGKLALFLLGLVVITEGILILAKRSDWRFLIVETARGFFRSSELSAVEASELSLTSWTMEELEETENMVFDHSLQLINEDYRISTNYDDEINEYKNSGVLMNSCIMSAYEVLSNEIQNKYGQALFISSSYRTPEKQRQIIATSASNVAAEVGASEHQAGLALDVYLNGFAGRAILKVEAGRYIYTNCYKYGFIIRYPLLKGNITNTTFEPWHIRYVGAPHAEIMYLDSLVLEEYMELLSASTYFRYGDYLITKQENEPFQLPEEFISGVVSPDNTGSYIITLKLN